MSAKISTFQDLIGHTIYRCTAEVGGECVRLLLATGQVFVMEHDQDCCEHVRIEDIEGGMDANDPSIQKGLYPVGSQGNHPALFRG